MSKGELEPVLKWFVTLVIYSKRKKINQSFNNVQNTGNSGLSPLLFAKQALIDFEEFISKEIYDEKQLVCIGWADKRRRKVYEYALKPLGYNYEMLQLYGDTTNKKYLIKKLY